jgi:predicted ATPase
MRLLARTGQRAAALAQYETCHRALEVHLGVEPAAQTIRLYEQIRDGLLEAPAQRSLVAGGAALGPKPPAFLGREAGEVDHKPGVFLGRERELARLRQLLDRAMDGEGQVVLVSGGPGWGKTALLNAFARRAMEAHPALLAADGRCHAYMGMCDPYLPFREIMAMLTGDVEGRWRAGVISPDRARRLWDAMPVTVQTLVRYGPQATPVLVAGQALLSRAIAAAPGGADWVERVRDLVEGGARAAERLEQSQLFRQVADVVRHLALAHPLLLTLDDLQWCDRSSIGLLCHLVEEVAGSRILIVGAYRPEEVALGRGGERHPLEAALLTIKRQVGDRNIDLARMGEGEARAFVDAFLDTEPNRLGMGFRRTLSRYTAGHPLFTVEILRAMEERGGLVRNEQGLWVEGQRLDWRTLPAPVEAVIEERIGRLSKPLREALRVGSVEGEAFTLEVIAQVQAADEREIVDHLSRDLDRKHRLVEAEGMWHLGPTCLSRYRFRHILYQRYLYNSLDPVERAHLHKAVGAALEALCDERPDVVSPSVSVQLAHHFRQAGMIEKAVDYLRQAGEMAVRMSASEEAIAHFTQALDLLKTLPDSPARAEQELMLQISLAAPLQIAKGYSSPEVGRVYARARELCRQVEGTPQIFPVLHLLAVYYGTRGQHRASLEIARQHLDLASQTEDPIVRALAHWMVGWGLTFLGRFKQARTHLERVIDFYDPQQHLDLAFLYGGQDPGVSCLALVPWSLWSLGYPDQALERSEQALAVAQELNQPFGLSIALGTAGATFHQMCRDVETAQELAEACIAHSSEHRFPFWLLVGNMCHGWTLAQQGQAEKGIAELEGGLSQYRAMGGAASQSHLSAMLGEAYGRSGQVQKGLSILAEALAIVDRTEERYFEAEIHRLKGALQHRRGQQADAEASFQKAIAVARQQGARSWELRATMSLCRLWEQQGKREEARRKLAKIYGWFSEGFDTPDLSDARALLASLS